MSVVLKLGTQEISIKKINQKVIKIHTEGMFRKQIGNVMQIIYSK